MYVTIPCIAPYRKGLQDKRFGGDEPRARLVATGGDCFGHRMKLKLKIGLDRANFTTCYYAITRQNHVALPTLAQFRYLYTFTHVHRLRPTQSFYFMKQK